MPQHKVSKAVNEIARLKDQVKEETVLGDGSGVIDAVLSGDKEEALGIIARQMKDFQISQADKVVAGAKAGEELGKGLLQHING